MSDFLSLPPEFQLSWYNWALAMMAAFIVGVAKSGLKGIFIIVVTIMALIFGGKASTGIVLPLLMVGDLLAVIYYNQHAQWKYLIQLLPAMAIGVVVGSLVGRDLPEAIFTQGMAIIILLSVILMFWYDRKKADKVPKHYSFGLSMGFAAGFTTMVGNLAGPVANIFFLAMRLPKEHFIGTAAWLFFIINIFKAPFHIFMWETITPATLALNLRLIPAELLGFFLGVRLIKLIKDDFYRKMILVLTALGALLILLR